MNHQVRQADIVVAAIGQCEYVQRDWLKPGCVVIDVGMNSKPDDTKKNGTKLCGDVDFGQFPNLYMLRRAQLNVFLWQMELQQ